MLIDINTLDIVVAIVMSLAVGVIVTTTIADAKKRKRVGEAKRHSDVYVFALLAHLDQRTINPMDVSQWRFYVLTNDQDYSNVAFLTFLPANLSLPRLGVNQTNPANATRPEADLDLYVSTDPGLTNLSPDALAAGFAHHLVKPVYPDALRLVLSACRP